MGRIFFATAFFLLAVCPRRSLAQAVTANHSALIRAWNDQSLARGKQLYETLCITCHGTPEKEGTLPTSRPFWAEPFKNGNDPFSIYKTLANGLGQMPAWTFLTPEQRYDAIHYIRETYVRPRNPSAYFQVTDEYLATLPIETESAVKPEGTSTIPPYLRMDFGPALFWTYQVASNNIAYKGIAIRLDSGAGGVSKGHAWMLYDHDTMRVAAAWTGDQFIDWRGIAFDGSHATHASIVGDKLFVNPVGPGWADPRGRFDDPRFRGRDGKPYGPLPRDWAHLKGVYYHSNQVVIAYTVGEAFALESPGHESGTFTRTLNLSKVTRALTLRIAPTNIPVAVSPNEHVKLKQQDGFHVLQISPSSTPLRLKIAMGKQPLRTPDAAVDLATLTKGGPSSWNPPFATQGKLGLENGPFAVDEIVPPPAASNPWQTWMRFGGFDFFNDGKRAAICTWNGDVWVVSGLDGDLSQVTWKRIVSGLFQPLGIKIVNETIHVTCRDQIARLHDLNGDEEIDYIENFNNDHQVTEHFHEFAMGLQTDSAGNFYYAKSARHALPAVVPHHGTLLKVSRDGSRTEIVANGFRAANGVCVNDDGTFFVTDQEGHWTPKNRINWVKPGGFYGNMFGYDDRASMADSDMEQPVVWITNEMDRSPGELVRISSPSWGTLNGSLLNLSYGTGRIFVVLHEKVGGLEQGGVVQLPIADLPTGVMRGRFHPNGHLYACGMYAWAGNRQGDGGFYRIRATGKPAWMPRSLHCRTNTISIEFTDALDPVSAATPGNYAIKAWSLKRSANYGSKHLDEHELKVANASLDSDGKTVSLQIPDLRPTQCMEIKATLNAPDGTPISRVIHNTIHTIDGLLEH